MPDKFDIVVIGAGAAGEAAALKAAALGATVAVVDRELFGGSCPFWACIPSKSLLHSSEVHETGGDYPWPKASDRRDYNINRVHRNFPDDSGHVKGLEEAGARVIRGVARLAGPHRVVVETADGTVELEASDVIVAVGSNSKIPDLPGIEQIKPWTNREATSARELPASLVVLGAGPTGVELAQVYARYGVRTTLVAPGAVNPKDHPRSSAALEAGLRASGVDVRTGVRAVRFASADGKGGRPYGVELTDGSTVEGEEILFAIGRAFPLEGLGLDTIGVPADGRLKADDHLRIAPNVYAIGDPAAPELATHVSHYQGEMAVRIAHGEDVTPDYRAIPHATYTIPECAGVGRTLERALADGEDAFEEVADLGTSAKGYVAEASGHVTIVVSRRSRELLGAFIAGPGASEAIHEAVLAIRARVPIDVLADTIHAFPTTARVMGGLFSQAADRLRG